MKRIIHITCMTLLATTMLLSSSAAAKDDKGGPPEACAHYDVTEDGLLNFTDLIVILMSMHSDTGALNLLQDLEETGCAAELSLDARELSDMLSHYAYCVNIDADNDGLITFTDAQLFFDSSAPVAEKIDVLILARRQNIQVSDDLYLGCWNVDPTTPLLTLPGLFDGLMARFDTCLNADLNEDGVLDVADLTLVWSKQSALSIQERIAYHDAITTDPLCQGSLF